MEKSAIREYKHRLPRELYKGKLACVFTSCIREKKELFLTKSIFFPVEKILLDCLRKEECEAYIYLFMPDHCHLLIEGRSDDSDLWEFMVNFKQRSGYWFSQNRLGAEWQKDFYDHILRKEEDLVKQIRYILGNPLRKGLVDNWRKYPYKGSTIYNLDEWV